jgi:hypothetical protein
MFLIGIGKTFLADFDNKKVDALGQQALKFDLVLGGRLTFNLDEREIFRIQAVVQAGLRRFIG